MTKRKLDIIAPGKPKKFDISVSLTIFPIPGSLAWWVARLIKRKEEKKMKVIPKETFSKNNLKLP